MKKSSQSGMYMSLDPIQRRIQGDAKGTQAPPLNLRDHDFTSMYFKQDMLSRNRIIWCSLSQKIMGYPVKLLLIYIQAPAYFISGYATAMHTCTTVCRQHYKGFNIVKSLRDREVACSASDRQG